MRKLIIGDIHEPCAHPGYRRFCLDLRDKYRCDDRPICIGDEADFHAISFHARHPEMPGPKDEYLLTRECLKRWHRVFPEMDICIGNHTERVARLAETVNIPSQFLRTYQDVWGTPGWKWAYEFIVDDVYYFHGTGNGGVHPAFNAMSKMLMSVVMGHVHTAAGVKWKANPTRRIFGMDTGCGIDEKALAFAYGKHLRQRAVISACVVIDGIPYHEVCPIGPGEKYHRSRFKRRKT